MSDQITSPTAVLVAECFAPASPDGVPTQVAHRVGAACADLRAGGAEIAYLGALVMADDELAFHVFTTTDAEVVLEAGRRAALRVERVVRSEAIGLGAASPAARRTLAVPVEVERPVAHEPREIGP